MSPVAVRSVIDRVGRALTTPPSVREGRKHTSAGRDLARLRRRASQPGATATARIGRKQRCEQNASRGCQNAGQVLATLRTEQRDPGHGGRAAEVRGAKNGRISVPLGHGRQETRSRGLRHVAAIGLSAHYCSLVRVGKRTPHARHWRVQTTLRA